MTGLPWNAKVKGTGRREDSITRLGEVLRAQDLTGRVPQHKTPTKTCSAGLSLSSPSSFAVAWLALSCSQFPPSHGHVRMYPVQLISLYTYIEATWIDRIALECNSRH